MATCMLESCQHISHAMDHRITKVAELCGEVAEATAKASLQADEALKQIREVKTGSAIWMTKIKD